MHHNEVPDIVPLFLRPLRVKVDAKGITHDFTIGELLTGRHCDPSLRARYVAGAMPPFSTPAEPRFLTTGHRNNRHEAPA